MSLQDGAAVNKPSNQTKQQTSSRMMKTTRRGRPYAKDTHDLFATLIVSLELSTHRLFFKSYPNSFTTDEAAENLSALKFSQSNRVPDPKEPSRVVTTTTTTTFSMNREMAKGICQHFMDARLIENAADPHSAVFKDKGVYRLTPKGLHMLERFIAKNGINAEHLQKVFNSQPIYMKLLHLDRRVHDDELLINRPIVEVLFRRFSGRQPNYIPGTASGPDEARAQTYDRTLGIGLSDIRDRSRGSKGSLMLKHTFSAVLALDWLCDHTTICGRDEAAEICAHFQRLGLIELVKDSSSRRESDDDAVVVRGEDGIGRVSAGEFRCHYKAIYGMTDKGRAVARWPGYTHLPDMTSSGSGSARQSRDASSDVSHNDSLGGPGARGSQSMDPERGSASLDSRGAGGSVQTDPSAIQRQPQVRSQSVSSKKLRAALGEEQQEVLQNHSSNGTLDSKAHGSSSGVHSTAPSTASSSGESRNHLFRKTSAAEALRNDYMLGSSGPEPPMPSSAYNSRDSNTNRLSQIIDEPALRSLFRDFLRHNFCEENLSFVIDVRDFKQRFSTTSSAVAVRPGNGTGGGGGDGAGRRGGLFNRNPARQRGEPQDPGYTAMEKHQQDLIASAFKIYATYLAPMSPKELNLEHNLRAELINYMTKVLGEVRNSAGADAGSKTASAQDLVLGAAGGSDSPAGSSAALPLGLSGPMTGGAASSEEGKNLSSVVLPRPTLHASQLQTIVRLYERISEHIWRLMATDSVPRFIKDARFLNLVKSVEEYTEALESGRLDPSVAAGPSISKHVVDAMDLDAGQS